MMKWKILGVITIGILVILGMSILMKNKDKPKEEKKYGELKLLGTEEEYGDPENVAYYQETGGEYEQEIITDTTNMVYLKSEHILFENGIDDYGINSLDDYLLRYLNYYLGEEIYEAEIREGSFEEDTNYPRFEVTVNLYHDDTVTYKIKCTYKRQKQRYAFNCKEIEGLKEPGSY